jgi:hypothetical protein
MICLRCPKSTLPWTKTQEQRRMLAQVLTLELMQEVPSTRVQFQMVALKFAIQE